MTTSLKPRTLSETLLKANTAASHGLLALAGSLLIALLAQIAVPIGPVPVTGQTLGVLLTAAVLGPRRGTLAVILYLGEGALGLPVFAGGRAGIMVLAGPTGGYLAGFVVAALVVGGMAQSGMDRRPSTALFSMLLGTATIYLFGVAWLSRFVGWSAVLPTGVYPFLIGDALKAGIATAALPGAWSAIRKATGTAPR